MMHIMTDSAIISLAAQRKIDTTRRLTLRCRQLTLQSGLHGFTVEEVCSEVGVSRRTFFNYFASKEDAVLGIDGHEDADGFARQFLELGPRGWPAVVDDLLMLAARVVEIGPHDVEEHRAFMRMLDQEPKLLARFIGITQEREAGLLALVAEREGVGIDDGHARASVDIVSTVLRSVGSRLSNLDVADNFGATILDTLTAMRDVLAPGKARS